MGCIVACPLLWFCKGVAMSQNTNRGLIRFGWAVLTATVCIVMLTIPAWAELPGQTADKSVEGDSNAYLPVIVNIGTNEPAGPILISPDDNAVLQTLIPTFRWDMGQPRPGVSTIACLAWGTSVDELDGCWVSGFGSNGLQQHIAHFNLEPDTLYFWRVGFIYDFNYDDIHWSGTRRFTTAPAGGVVLPPPTLISPANESAIPQDEIVLIWSEVAGAVRYDVTVRNIDTDNGYGWAEYEGTRLNLSSMAWWGIEPGDNYKWTVAVRNDYAWSDESAPWSFSVLPPTNGRDLDNSLSRPTWSLVRDGTTWIYSQG